MPSGLTILTPPTSEPLSLDEVYNHLRQEPGTDDDAVSSLITEARQYIESAYDRALITQTLQATYDRFPRYSSSAVWQYNSDAIWQQRLPVTQLSGQWYPDRASIRLSRPPLVSVVSITYASAADGSIQTVDPATYNVDTTTEPGRVAPAYGQIWPIVRQQLASVTCTYTAGYGDAAQVPGPVKRAMKLLIGHWYEHREAVGMAGEKVALAVDALLMSVWDAEYR